MEFFSTHLNFWKHHPALFYGLSLLLGIYASISALPLLIIPCCSLWLPYFLIRTEMRQLFLSFLVFFSGWFYTSVHYTIPNLPETGITGNALVKIKSLSYQHSLFGARWIYRCELAQFFPQGDSSSIATSLPCQIILPGKQMNRPSANRDYWIEGRLIQSQNNNYQLKVSVKTIWIPVDYSWSLAEKRYAWKSAANQWIQNAYPNPMSASFLSGLATGEFDDNWLQQQFARFGLQHLLAISGFHFALTASFLSLFLSLFFSNRWKNFILILCLAIYCLFLGPQPSVLRAWLMCSLACAGLLIERQTSALNALGVALLLVLGFDPYICQSLGFQLSFAIAAAILLFFQPSQRWISELLPKRPLHEVITMNLRNQHGYCLIAFLRGGLALLLAVNLIALPLTLFYFHQFPWMSLLYNLFFPFMASASMSLLFLGTLFSFVPWLGSGIHALNNAYTDFLLRLTYQVPTATDGYLTVQAFHPFWLILYLSLITLAGIWWKEKTNHQEESFAMI